MTPDAVPSGALPSMLDEGSVSSMLASEGSQSLSMEGLGDTGLGGSVLQSLAPPPGGSFAQKGTEEALQVPVQPVSGRELHCS